MRAVLWLLLLYGCASPAPLTCPAWDDLGGWQVWGGAIVLQRDACGKSTTGAIRGPVDLHLAGESGAWNTAVGDLVAELGGAGVCLITKLAATLPGSQPQAAGELAAPTDPRRDLAGQRAREWLRANRYEVPQ